MRNRSSDNLLTAGSAGAATDGGRRPPGRRPLLTKLILLYIPVLILVTGFILLDTFVLPDVQQVVAATDTTKSASSADSSEADADGDGFIPYSELEEENEESGESGESGESEDADADSDSSGEAVITDTSYQDKDIQITLTETRVSDTNVYIADVKVSDSSYLKTAFAQGIFGRNIKETTSETAAANNAILAINGDYYGFRNYGYVLRNGELYRSNGNGTDDLVIDADGNFSIVNESEVSAESLLEQGAQQVLSFGPALIEDSQIVVDANSEVSQSTASNPRTAIGIIDSLHYVFVVSDGRNDESAGLSLLQLAQVMQEQGCSTAYNLDGGGSSTMVFNGQVVNNPSGGRAGHGSSERSVSDIIYIG